MHFFSEIPELYPQTGFDTVSEPPTAAPSTSILGRRMLFIADAAVKEQSNLAQKLLELFKDFTETFGSELNTKFQYIHQRYVKTGYVKDTFEGWKNELEQLDKRMNSAWDAAIKLCEAIPAISNQKEKADSLVCMMHFEYVAMRLKEKSKELQCALADGKHQALETYKGRVKLAKSLAEIQNLDAALLNSPPTSICFAVPLDPQSTLAIFIEEAKQVVLPKENYFRVGEYFRGWPLLGYTAIKTQVTNLEGIARGLWKVQMLLDEQIKSAFEGFAQADFVKTHLEICEGLERCIGLQVEELRGLPFSNQIHAGWYYAVALFAQSKALRRALEQFEQINAGSDGSHKAALHSLVESVKCANLRHKGSVAEPLLCFYAATRALCAVDRPLNEPIRVITVMDQTLAHDAHASLQLVEQEVEIPTRVFGLWMHKGFRSEIFQAYLTRSFLRNLHFSEQQCDPEFEMVLYMLKYNPMYKVRFEKCLEGSKVLKDLHDAYVQQTDAFRHIEMLHMMNDIIVTISAPLCETLSENDRSEDVFVRYNKALYVLIVLKGLYVDKSSGDKLRMSWIEDKLKQFAKGSKEAPNLTASPLKPLYDLLCTSLFVTEPKAKSEADNAIVAMIEEFNFSKTPLQGLVKLLMYRWTLERFVDYCNRRNETGFIASFKSLALTDTSDAEMQILRALFHEYNTDRLKTAFWRSQYDTGYMEIALCEFNRKTKMYSNARDLDLLEKVIAFYTKFRKIIDTHGHLVPDTKPYNDAKALYEKAKACFGESKIYDESINTQDNKGLASWFCIEMNQFLSGHRVCYYYL